ncbi:HAD-IA family hydrolase [Rhodobacter sp. Har01]|uniref:HAD-IA family hydrolase n=1 Tax=Rhodobacter sp. Har01 TaxID=2883999 RepID=UPI001D065BAE|nr:HAD-IA family hydrolase [Rhodobacter sp. Har01]MCB6179368.1 HAD-IA family hydrolase [Rhodobacter sp. Har01]
MTPLAVVYDIGNVLLGWDPEAMYDARIGPEARRRFFAEVPIHAANVAMDAGAPFEATLNALARAYPAWQREILWWRDDWVATLGPVIQPSVTLLRALRSRGVPVFALTNFGAETFQIARAAYPFLDEFDRAWVSGRMGVIKPDPAIYAAVEADCGLPPDRLLFTDDKAANIDAAAARGWRAHLFDSPEGWAARLVAEGLLSETEAAP